MKKNKTKIFQYILGIGIILLNLHTVSVGGQDDSLSYSESEVEALSKLRPLVKEYLTEFFMSTDAFLFRWLKSVNMDIPKAVTKLKKLYDWREKNNMENILDEDLSEHDGAFPHKIDGFTKTGLPSTNKISSQVVQILLGEWQFGEYLMAGKHKIIQRYFYQLMEKAELKAHNKAKQTGAKLSQTYFLSDMNGYNYKDQECIPCTPMMLDLTRYVVANHPYFISKSVLINVPEGFRNTMNLLKQLMSEQQANSTCPYGRNKRIWQPVILADIDEDQIPPIFGGTKVEGDGGGIKYKRLIKDGPLGRSLGYGLA